MSENTVQVGKKVKITKGDRRRVAWRSTYIQACWNYERMHNVGFAYSLAPLLKKLYPNKEDYTQALQRHLEFINTHPYLQSPIIGVTMAFEERRANGADIDDAAINGVKVGMMGPFAGVGDPIFWGTIRPVIGAFVASLALSGSGLGPILFFLLWNIIRIAFMWYTQELGYRSGERITEDLSGGIIQKITTAASILGMFIMGVLVPRWTTMNFPLVISQVENSPETMVNFDALVKQANENALNADTLRNVASQIQDGLKIGTVTTQTLGDIFNQILPGLMPLILTFFCLHLMRKKNVSSIKLIFGIFALGIVMYVLGIMG